MQTDVMQTDVIQTDVMQTDVICACNLIVYTLFTMQSLPCFLQANTTVDEL